MPIMLLLMLGCMALHPIMPMPMPCMACIICACMAMVCCIICACIAAICCIGFIAMFGAEPIGDALAARCIVPSDWARPGA